MVCIVDYEEGNNVMVFSLSKKSPQQSVNYFEQAQSWADDLHAVTIASRNRWRAFSLYVLIPLSFVLIVCVTFLIPLQHLEPILINHYSDGTTSVAPIHPRHLEINRAQIESDLVRYVVNRESYSADSYQTQYSLVNLLSSNTVAKEYIANQSIANKKAPINILGEKGTRNVHITSILFLDQENNQKIGNHRNLAQVDFTVTERDRATNLQTTIPLTALISWQYHGMPQNPNDAWQNWDGLTITNYEIQQRVISNN